MKIIYFSVNNFGCLTGGIKNNTVKFDGSNTIFLFGQNNAGKSSFLRAYDIIFNDHKILQSDFHKQDVKNVIEMVIEVELTQEEIDEFGDKKQNALNKYFYGTDNNRLTFKKIWEQADKKATNNLTLKKDKTGYDDIGYAGIGEHNFLKINFQFLFL